MKKRALESLAIDAVGKTIASIGGDVYSTQIAFTDGSVVTLSGDYLGEVNAEWLTPKDPSKGTP